MENWGRRRKEITVETQKPQLGTGHQCITRVWVGKKLGMCNTKGGPPMPQGYTCA